MISREDAQKYYIYNPVDGTLYSRKTRRFVTKNTSHNYRQYRVYQIAFLLMAGYIPEMIDHKDGDRDNNKWLNLRAATPVEQSANTKKKAVYKSASGKFYYQLQHNGKRYYKGGFADYKSAVEEHRILCNTLQGDFSLENSGRL